MSAPVSPALATPSSAPPLDQGSFRPHPPENGDFGRKPGHDLTVDGQVADDHRVSQVTMAVGVMARRIEDCPGQGALESAEVFGQLVPAAGQHPPHPELSHFVHEGLSLIDELRPPRNLGGRPRAIDDVAKIKIATLMATGASLRQVAGFLGVSHSTVSAAIAADPALKQEIDAARQRAVLHPLACVVRESGRNWKAAVWLMDYLNKQSVRDQPADDRNREEAEARAAAWIQHDLAEVMRQQAKLARLATEHREENDQWRREVAARKARKLARAQGQSLPPASP
jgi:hypothetical protein